MQGIAVVIATIAVTVGVNAFNFETKFLDLKADSLEMAMLSNPSHYSLGEWALIASGVSENEFNVYINKLRTIYENVESSIKNVKKDMVAQKIFDYLHQKVFLRYVENSTSLREIIESGKFNCYSATLLYMMMLERHDISYAAVILPDHIYAMVKMRDKWVSVETTEALGFDIRERKQKRVGFQSRYGFQYPKNATPTTNELQIVSYLYANRAYLYSKEKKPYLAFQTALKGAIINPSGEFIQSNMIAAYNEYSQSLYKASNYLLSLEVLKEAYHNYPANIAIRNNLKLVFNRYIQYLWVENNDLETAMSVMLDMSKYFPKE